jgi:uncharacterized protein (DUF433 family)
VAVDADVLDGKPHVAGSHIPVALIWRALRAGIPLESILKRYAELGPAKIHAALAFAYDNRALLELDMAHDEETLRARAIEAQKTEAARRENSRREDLPRSQRPPRYGR